MVGKIHKKKISEYTENADNDDKQSDRGEENEEEMNLDYVDPSHSGSGSENGEAANNDNNKGAESLNPTEDAGDDDVERTDINNDDTDFHPSDGGDEADDEGKTKKAKKRKAPSSKKSGENESDDEPVNGGSPKKRGRKPGTAKTKANSKGKSNVKKSVNDEDEENEEEYEVKDIVDHKTERGVSYFLIRWKGYSKADDTWEPEDTLNCPEIIERYKKKQKESPKNASAPVKKKGGKGAVGRGSKKIDEDEDQEWEVEKIIDYAQEKKGRVFRIRWKGFGPKNDTWEPEENLNCSDIVQKFLAKMKSQENISFKELREEPKKTKRLVNETAPRTNISNPIGRKSKRSVTKKRVFYGGMDD